MIVMKFGGTSVENAEAIQRVCQIVEGRQDKAPVVVVSAVAKTTDELVALSRHARQKESSRVADLIDWIVQKHQKIAHDLGLGSSVELANLLDSAREELTQAAHLLMETNEAGAATDQILNTGELLSSNLLAVCLRSSGLPGIWADSRRVLITDSNFGAARPLLAESAARAQQLLIPLLKDGKIPVTQGFVGADAHGRVTTLGRGGSDYSATLMAASIEAEAVEIWTDVDGVMTADPNLVRDVHRIRWMTFAEASELAYFGAKVLHPATLSPAVKRGIPVFVLNSRRPGETGTEIVPSARPESQPRVKSIAYKSNLAVVTMKSTRMLMAYGFLSKVFEVFARFETPVDLVATSEVSVSVTIDNTSHLAEIRRQLQEFAEVEVDEDKAIVCVVGERIGTVPGMPAQVFDKLHDVQLHLISQGASEINISFVVDEADLPRVVRRLHAKFFEDPLDEEIFAASR